MNDDLSLIYGRYFEEVSQAFNAIRDNFIGDDSSDSAGSTDSGGSAGSSDFPSQVSDFFNSLIQSQLEPEPQPQPQPQPEPMPGYGYGYDYGYYGGGEVVVETKPRICTKDMFRCPDGSLVSRDENCNFRPCPEPQQSPRIYRRGIPGFLIPTPNGGTEWVPEFGYGWNKYGVWAPKLTENSFLEEDYGYGGEEVVVATPEPVIPISQLPEYNPNQRLIVKIVFLPGTLLSAEEAHNTFWVGSNADAFYDSFAYYGRPGELHLLENDDPNRWSLVFMVMPNKIQGVYDFVKSRVASSDMQGSRVYMEIIPTPPRNIVSQAGKRCTKAMGIVNDPITGLGRPYNDGCARNQILAETDLDPEEWIRVEEEWGINVVMNVLHIDAKGFLIPESEYLNPIM